MDAMVPATAGHVAPFGTDRDPGDQEARGITGDHEIGRNYRLHLN
jgi:hypothetical protein